MVRDIPDAAQFHSRWDVQVRSNLVPPRRHVHRASARLSRCVECRLEGRCVVRDLVTDSPVVGHNKESVRRGPSLGGKLMWHRRELRQSQRLLRDRHFSPADIRDPEFHRHRVVEHLCVGHCRAEMDVRLILLEHGTQDRQRSALYSHGCVASMISPIGERAVLERHARGRIVLEQHRRLRASAERTRVKLCNGGERACCQHTHRGGSGRCVDDRVCHGESVRIHHLEFDTDLTFFRA